MSNGYKRCPNGHFYKEDLATCPFCSSQNQQNPMGTQAQTQAFVGGGSGNNNPTVANGMGMDGGNKTQVMPGNNGATVPNSGAFTSNNNMEMPKQAPMHTMIIDEGGDTGQSNQVRNSRKLVGWLVSYTLSDMGVDFKLFEGRNVIGRDLDCQINVDDKTVSSKHATLLYREGSYFIQDNLSTSGTRVNGRDTGVEAVTLNDGDIIRVGKTDFKFRTSF